MKSPPERYRGDGTSPNGNEKTFAYLADPKLRKTVNMAIALKRPLLVKGPPGCGKTKLAESISHELGLKLYPWFVKSTSKARDGLYSIDAIGRLYDAQTEDPNAKKLTPYIRFGPLGEAIRSKQECVVLLDEIDKADLDFPNDLLRELDRMEFEIEELDESKLDAAQKKSGWRRKYESTERPIVIVTSNDEKQLPDAFLRRCLFHYIEFPRERLVEIVKANMEQEEGINVTDELVKAAAIKFCEFIDLPGLMKSPATSELIDWVMLLFHWGIEPEQIESAGQLTDVPLWQSLLKHRQDQKQVHRVPEAKDEA